MTRTLVLYLDDSWPSRRDCPWVVTDAREVVIEQGCSAPAHWPAAAATVVVMGGAQCALHSVQLPRSARREEEALLRYALEEKLVDEVDQQHFVVTDRRADDGGQLVSVLVMARARLRQLVGELQALGRTPDRVVAELQLAASHAAEAWALALGPTGGLLLSAGKGAGAGAGPANGAAWRVDATSVVDILALLCQQARARNRTVPPTLRLLCAPGQTLPNTLEIATLELRPSAPETYRWWYAPERAVDLLQGEFARARRSGGLLRRVRAPALVTTLALAALLVATVVEVVTLRGQLAELDARMQRTFATALPGTPAIAPALQLRRELDQQLSAHGKLRNDDLLQLLDVVSDTAGDHLRTQLEQIDYQDGALSLRFAPGTAEITLIAARLETLGWAARPHPEQPSTLNVGTRRAP